MIRAYTDIKGGISMNSLEVTSTVTALANALACGRSTEDIVLLSSVMVMLGDTLATIATVRDMNENNQCCCDNSKQRLSP